MNPFLAVAFGLLPDLVRLIAGDKAGIFADKVSGAVKSATNAGDEKAAQAKVDADPALKAQLQKQLADMALEETKEQNRAEEAKRQSDFEVLREQLAEAGRAREYNLNSFREELKSTQDARAFYNEMAKTGGAFSWVNPALSLLITLGFMALIFRLMSPDMDLQNNQVFNIALGAFATAFATVIGFHFGSSVGSKEKDNVNRVIMSEQAARRTESSAGQPTEGAFPGSYQSETPGPISSAGLFERKAPAVMRDLIRDFNFTAEQTAGILGNIGHECDGFRQLQERGQVSPKGGWGWCQWTGPRRRAFETWASEHGYSPSSDEANYGFLKNELNSSEKAARDALRKASSVEDATRIFMDRFERPGSPQLARRVTWANRAIRSFRGGV